MNIIKKIIEIFQDTGERPVVCKKIEEINNPSIKFAYEKIIEIYQLKNKKILDFGCGGGYGTEFLSRYTNKFVTGYDIDKKTIEINKKFYKKNKNLNFISNQKEVEKYDLITCFQVIEHIHKENIDSFIKFLKKCLLPNGKIVFATPNKNITSYKLKKPVMVFHQIEYTKNTLLKLLDIYFNNVHIYGQISELTLKNIDFRKVRFSINTKFIRFISQFEIIRIISRHLPMKFKLLFMGSSKMIKEKYKLTKNKNEINNSFILIAFCK